ncbi:3899_t:CDS:2, partial [Cetraspora pellucida]
SFELYKVILDIRELDKHNASDIIKLVNLVLNKFNIDHLKIFTITTDNNSNIKSAMQQLNITNVKCAGHTLQLSVNLGLKEVDDLISKYKSLIAILSKEKNVNSFVKLNYKLLQVTQYLSGSKYPILGFLTPILEELTCQLRYFTEKSNKAILVKEIILDNLIEHWEDPSE